MTGPHATREHCAELGLGRCRWLEAGAGAPVVLLHGMGIATSADNLRALIERLARRRRVLAPDLLGFGEGVRVLADGPTFELILAHLREWLDLQDTGPVDLVGHSLGGWVGAWLAYESPHYLRRLVMLSAAGLNRTPAPGIRSAGAPGPVEIRAQLAAGMAHPEAADPAILDAAVAAGVFAAGAPGALAGLEPLLRQMETPQLRARYLLHRPLARVRVPVLHLWGEAERMEPYPTWTQEFGRLGGELARSSKPWGAPGARYVLLAGAGHFPHLERPDATAREIGAFLDA
jgi:2-hydroxy-6-oxonona-2,4-dienedioate hydrolase